MTGVTGLLCDSRSAKVALRVVFADDSLNRVFVSFLDRDVGVGYVVGVKTKPCSERQTETPKLARYKPDGGVAWGQVPLFFVEVKPKFDRQSAAADQCVLPSHFVFACAVRGLMMTASWRMSSRVKLAAMCAGAFHLYWAAMKDDKQFACQHWAGDPYLSSALPAIQVNGSSVAVYYARIKPGLDDATFTSTSTLGLLIVVSKCAP